MYIIDGNNLAGKLKWLKQKDFDRKLIDCLTKYFVAKKKKVLLVFDGGDSLGDRLRIGNMTVIYSPQDKYCQSADDKIIEIIENLSLYNDFSQSQMSEIFLVTDDNELKKRANKAVSQSRVKVSFINTTSLAEKIISQVEAKKETNDGQRGLSKEKIDNINRELREIWQK